MSPRRFFASTRRRLLAFVGRVAVRGRRTSSAWRQPLGEPLERQLAVAQLRARVLRGRA